MRIPVASYRLQLNRNFDFAAAEAIVPYLSELGITDIYASPILKAREGSVHGYDVLDPNQINPELGGMAGFEKLHRAVKKQDLGWIQDFVPNHMAYDGQNWMLMDVLENGPSSRYSRHFDFQWDHPFKAFKGKLLAPFLGKFYGECLEEGEITLKYDAAGFSINYYSIRLPLKIETYSIPLSLHLDELRDRLESGHPDLVKIFGVLYAIKNLPTIETMEDRYDQIRFIKQMLWDLYETSDEIRNFMNRNLEIFNGQKGIPESYTLLDHLLAEQSFRLLFWKVATEEINYRRFFNVNDLISLRIEDPTVFQDIHSLLFQLLEREWITGLRIDHVDGLYDPTGYLKNLRHSAGDTYLVVEKILELDEKLPSFWPVEGTTGYDFLGHVNALFCDRRNKSKFTDVYCRFTKLSMDYRRLVIEKKRLFIGRHMAGDIDRIAQLLKQISSRDRRGVDLTLYALKRALVELLALFPVYRTYVNREFYSEFDREIMQGSIQEAIDRSPELLRELEFIEKFLMLHFPEELQEEEKDQWMHFVMRFQQLTAPIMAKGFEDSTFYVYNRLISLNEVGGNPDRFGISKAEFHDFNKDRIEKWPHTLNTTSTHDTKRGEDVRARLNVLSELGEEWEKNLRHWSKLNRPAKKKVNRKFIPDKNDEYFLYQTILGALPFSKEEYPEFLNRLKGYVIKAVREAKIHTAWLKPDAEYENAYLAFVEEILRFEEGNAFLNSFLPFQQKISFYGVFNSLSQVVLKITSPGVPDVYQGTELWDFSLVDPDNRRPVDFQKRENLLKQIKRKEEEDVVAQIEDMLQHPQDGLVKLFTLYKCLKARQEHVSIFERGDYIPLKIEGKRDHAIAFQRQREKDCSITIVPRRVSTLFQEGEGPYGEKVWGDSRVLLKTNSSTWRNIFTNEVLPGEGSLRLSEIFRHFPVAVLINM
jgi:(1->4)-alpha-D-glucan 1-alpha-D-glucosylmutase